MPFSVDYFIDVSHIGPDDLEWNERTRTLIVNAPDVKPARPNVDEAARTLVRTNGMFVTRKAAEELSRRTSALPLARSSSWTGRAQHQCRRDVERVQGVQVQDVEEQRRRSEHRQDRRHPRRHPLDRDEQDHADTPGQQQEIGRWRVFGQVEDAHDRRERSTTALPGARFAIAVDHAQDREQHQRRTSRE